MTNIDDYRSFLKAKLKSAESILNDAMTRKESGEIMKANYLSMWRKEIREITAQLDKERNDPQTFGDDASIWAKRMAFALH